tara:strand:- start:1093 stop:1374 length:282 start_codon:yes stop_codon:yes gene_type:complete
MIKMNTKMKFQSNKYKIFCALQFGSTLTSAIGLIMSVYELAQHKDEDWVYLNYVAAACISTSIVLNSIKDSLMSNPKIFLTDEQLEEYNSPPI